MKAQIQAAVAELFPKLLDIRGHIHAHPELSFQEFETTAYIKRQLDELGISYEDHFTETGLVAYIKGQQPERKTIALRADIDALPIQETNQVDYVSKHPGIMHACGHDVHTTCLLGAAGILHRLRDQFSGTIKLIFQPGEERLPGGASLMIKAGVLEQPRVETIIGQHVHPPLEVGKIGLKPGLYMASADELFVTITGQGGHAALPEDLIDPIIVMNALLPALRAAVNSAQPASIPTVLAFGKVMANGATNVIPDKVHIEGTLRTMDEDWRARIHDILRTKAAEIAQQHDCEIDMDVRKGYPCLVNDAALTSKAKAWAQEYLGEENVVDLPIRMTAEDFSFYSHQVPGCFFRLGTGNPAKGITSPVHTSTFDIDQEALKVGAGMMAWMAYKQLEA
ncbi:MAG: amidohydrolase [Saprospiraceae bacterium]|nr:amidohydrolase [Saprospiraceae bacterium]